MLELIVQLAMDNGPIGVATIILGLRQEQILKRIEGLEEDVDENEDVIEDVVDGEPIAVTDGSGHEP